MSSVESPHLLLGRIRFINRCIECFCRSEPVPECLCYVPREVCYKTCKDSSSASGSSRSSAGLSSVGRTILSVFDSPHKTPQSKKLSKYHIEPKKGAIIRTTGEEYCNSQGLWVKMNKEQLDELKPGQELEEGWILACKHTDGGIRLVPLESADTLSRQKQLFGSDCKPCHHWEQAVDVENALFLGNKPKVAESDKVAVQRLRFVPPTWTYESDEDLVHYFYEHLGNEDELLGSIKQYVTSIEVSSDTDPSGMNCLTNGDSETYWESVGSQGQHWIRLHMKRGCVVSKLFITVDASDENFMPKRVTVYGGNEDNLKKLNEVTIDEDLTGDVCLLENTVSYFSIIEIKIEECKHEGYDVRIRGLNITSSYERDLGLSAEMLQSSNLVRFPRLQGTEPDVLYRRALVIQRFMVLLDSVLPHLVPAWDYSLGTFNHIKNIKHFLLLSKRRTRLINQCLKDSETAQPNLMPQLHINRRLAMEHRDNPSLDPSCMNTVFNQLYQGLKPSGKSDKVLNYRWPESYCQWWHCNFIAEGIIDQGGGFRDSLADMSEELCPSSAECPLPLPFFTRTSNEGNIEARDYYVPNPSCKEFQKYKWIGQLMGAAFRGKDFLVLALPGLVWKQLIGEPVSWTKDFPAVDSVLVNLLEGIENMDQETFQFRFGEELVYTTLLSDGQMVELIPGGSNMAVRFEDRCEFIRLVQKARLEESKQQIAAMQAGLLKVVPQAVLDLMTWQEVEKKVCGDPEISVDAIKRFTVLEDLKQTDLRVQYLWEALTNFTNEDRSRFLRFVTGRSRPPAPISVYPDRQETEMMDALPQSSTCGSTLYLPDYTSAEICEEKLRYAAYNCVAIDTDINVWED